MSVTADPLRNTLDHLSLDPNAAEDRKYLVSMLRRLGYTEREIEVYLGGGEDRIIEVEYRPGRTRTGTFSVVGGDQDGWVMDDHAARAGMGFSVARGHVDGPGGDPAVEFGWIHVDEDQQERVDFGVVEDPWMDDEPWTEPAEETAAPEVAPETDAWVEADDTAWPEPEEETWPEAENTEAGETAWPATGTAWPEEVTDDYRVDEAPADTWRPADETVEETSEWADVTDNEWEPTQEQTWEDPEPTADAWEDTESIEAEPTPAVETAPFTYGDYTLYTRNVELSSGDEQRIFFFAKNEPKSGHACPLPAGYQVEENRVTGLPFLRRDLNADTTEDFDTERWEDPAPVETTTTTRTSTTSKTAAQATTCAALTKAGTACKNNPRSNSKYCATHKGYRPRN